MRRLGALCKRIPAGGRLRTASGPQEGADGRGSPADQPPEPEETGGELRLEVRQGPVHWQPRGWPCARRRIADPRTANDRLRGAARRILIAYSKAPAFRPGDSWMQEKSGREAVKAFLAGDASILQEVRGLVEAAVASFPFHNADLNRDIVQDVLGRIVHSLRSGRFRGDASLKTYAYSVARYACIEHLRRVRHEGAMAPEADTADERDPGPEASLMRMEEHRRNLRALSALPHADKELLHLIFIQRLSYREVGLRLGLTDTGVKARVHRCRMSLRALSRREISQAIETPQRSGSLGD